MPINPHPLGQSNRYSVLNVEPGDTQNRKPGYYIFDNKKQKIIQEAFGLKDAESIVTRKNNA